MKIKNPDGSIAEWAEKFWTVNKPLALLERDAEKAKWQRQTDGPEIGIIVSTSVERHTDTSQRRRADDPEIYIESRSRGLIRGNGSIAPVSLESHTGDSQRRQIDGPQISRESRSSGPSRESRTKSSAYVAPSSPVHSNSSGHRSCENLAVNLKTTMSSAEVSEVIEDERRRRMREFGFRDNGGVTKLAAGLGVISILRSLLLVWPRAHFAKSNLMAPSGEVATKTRTRSFFS